MTLSVTVMGDFLKTITRGGHMNIDQLNDPRHPGEGRSVVEILINFQCKVTWTVEPIRFTHNDLYFVIDTFEFASADGVVQ